MDVKLDIKDLRNSNKLIHKSIEQVEDLLNTEFCHFESTVMTAIVDLTSKINGSKNPTQCNGFELEALASKGKQSDEIQNPLNVVMENQDTTNLTQEGLSGGIHVIPITKGKAPKSGQPVASSSKMQIDNTQTLAMVLAHDEWNPFMDKLSDVMAVHMGNSVISSIN